MSRTHAWTNPNQTQSAFIGSRPDHPESLTRSKNGHPGWKTQKLRLHRFASGAHLCVTPTRTSPAIKHTPHPRKGHEQLDTVSIYTHADMTIKERALARTRPLHIKPGRYRPRDRLLAFLDSL